MKIIFFGTEQWSAQFLEYLLLHDIKPLAVVTKEDRPVGRGLHLESSPVKKIALEYGLPVLQPAKCSSQECIDEIRSLKPTLCVLIAYGQILPKELLDIPEMGFINVHPSLLPLYRGPAPFQAPILNGDKKTGITLLVMDEKMDHGPILVQEKISLDQHETAQTLHEKVITQGCPLLVQTLISLQERSITPHEQDHAQATYTHRYKKEQGKIDWTKSCEEIERMVRALNPWPGTWIEWKNKRIKILKVNLVDPITSTGKELGQFFHSPQQDHLYIACGKNTLEIQHLQVEGKKVMTGKEFIHGYLKSN